MLRASDLIAGRYRLENQIAAAASLGELWEAVDLVQGRPVAVRLLAAQHADDPPMLERFRTAARLAASVSHPSVTQVVDYGDGAAGQPPYLVTELVEAPSLAGLLAVGPLEPARTMNVLALAASGLQAGHAAGLVHGDISPATLLVSPDGQVKITDFVTACCTQYAPVDARVSSPVYVAPELADDSPATPAGDLYSLGVVGYECLIGTPAFSRKTSRPSADPGRLMPPLPRSVPAGVAGLIDDLTARDPAKRPASAERVRVRAGLLRDSQAKGRNSQAKRRDTRADGHDSQLSRATGRHNSHRHGAPTPAPTPSDLPTPAPTPSDLPTPAPTPNDLPTPAPTLVEGQTAILSLPAQPPLGAPPSRRRSRWPVVVGGAGAVLAAVLVGWLLANVFTPPSSPSGPGRPAAAASTPITSARAPAAGSANLNDAALAGQPVTVVTQRLRQLGLRPRVVWADDSLQAPGTVITVQPTGSVPAGSLVTVTGAKRPPGRHHSGTH